MNTYFIEFTESIDDYNQQGKSPDKLEKEGFTFSENNLDTNKVIATAKHYLPLCEKINTPSVKFIVYANDKEGQLICDGETSKEQNNNHIQANIGFRNHSFI